MAVVALIVGIVAIVGVAIAWIGINQLHDRLADIDGDGGSKFFRERTDKMLVKDSGDITELRGRILKIENALKINDREPKSIATQIDEALDGNFGITALQYHVADLHDRTDKIVDFIVKHPGTIN